MRLLGRYLACASPLTATNNLRRRILRVSDCYSLVHDTCAQHCLSTLQAEAKLHYRNVLSRPARWLYAY